MKNSKKITLSTYITLIRLVGAPLVMPFLIVNYGAQNDLYCNILIASLFLFFGFTDFLDGFFARRYAQVTKLGATLDHLADKFLIFSALIGLVAIGKISYIWVTLLIGREFFIMGLRQIALEQNMHIAVSSWGKLKTALHIALISWIILNPIQMTASLFWNGIEAFLLGASLIISLWSAFDYSVKFYSQLKSR